MKRSLKKSALASPFPDRDPSVFDAAVAAFEAYLLRSGAKPLTARRATCALKRVARDLGSPIWTAQALRARSRARSRAGIRYPTWRRDNMVIMYFCDYLLDPAYEWRERFFEAYDTVHDSGFSHKSMMGLLPQGPRSQYTLLPPEFVQRLRDRTSPVMPELPLEGTPQ